MSTQKSTTEHLDRIEHALISRMTTECQQARWESLRVIREHCAEMERANTGSPAPSSDSSPDTHKSGVGITDSALELTGRLLAEPRLRLVEQRDNGRMRRRCATLEGALREIVSGSGGWDCDCDCIARAALEAVPPQLNAGSRVTLEQIERDVKSAIESEISGEADAEGAAPLKIYHCEDCGCRIAAQILNGPTEPMPHCYLSAGGGESFLGCCPICGGTGLRESQLALGGCGPTPASPIDESALL